MSAPKKPPAKWIVEEVKETDNATWVKLAETLYVATRSPKVGQILVKEEK
jgi:hypothetical protein